MGNPNDRRISTSIRGSFVFVLLLLGACSGGDALDGSSWQAVQLGPRPTVPDVVSTAEFRDGRISGSGGCNSYGGVYEAGETEIEITELGGTEMACDDLVMEQERAFFDALPAATSYRIVTDRLELLEDDDLLVAFVRTRA